MEVISKTSESDLASVYISKDDKGRLIEFVESTQPPYSINEKWVLIISTLFGCPIDCKFCDAGGMFNGKMSYEDLKFQIDYLVQKRFPDGYIDTDKFKIQFARMGEPSFNSNVLDLLRNIPELYNYRYFLPSLSTIAPIGTDLFFEKLLEIKKELYRDTFQLQFSLHSTDEKQRDILMPVRKWSFEKIADYGSEFYDAGGKKITLNFALSSDSIFDIDTLLEHFSSDIFILKITPLNPTYKALKNSLKSMITEKEIPKSILDKLQSSPYEYIISIGEWEENQIGSNCGQYISSNLKICNLPNAYSYPVCEVG